ncbi:5'-3' exonuclease H3TH domain-containing protein [Salinisphaera sp. SPP-AMP-43]|uniref:5'-3' exonuclease n=1 Tax=Salinisphaera sp. SPP-AMP-43 TaxID=3121288 RepID=UPI003C6E4884
MLLIDASVYIFRAFHALPDSITGRGGRPLNAVHGYATFLTGLLEQVDDDQIAAAFDESLTSSFRNEWFADYKANREAPPAELVDQIAACRELTEGLGIATLSSPRYEADDLIGSLAAGAQAPVTIVTSDKDLAQLLGTSDVLWDYAREARYDRQAIQARFGVVAEHIPDYLALVGDAVDNIPGVPGIGAKTAAALLARFDSLETMLADLEAVRDSGLRGAKSLAGKLDTHAEQARLSRRLAVIVIDIELEPAQRDIRRRAANLERLDALCQAIGAGHRLRRQLGLSEYKEANP